MKLSEIITSVQGLLQDDQFSTTKITEAANWVQDEIFADTRTRIMETSDTLSAATGDTTVSLPDDIQTMIDLYVTVPQVFNMKNLFVEYGDFMQRFANFATTTSSEVRAWTDFGNEIRFSAPINADHTFALDYLRRPVRMVSPNDVCEIPDAYREIISRGTLARCMEQNEDYGEAATERRNIAPLITTFKRNEGRGQIKTGPTIMRSNRRRSSVNSRGDAFGLE